MACISAVDHCEVGVNHATDDEVRFDFTPDNVRWGSSLRKLKIGAQNVLQWRGRDDEQLPVPGTAASPWLLPATDDAAVAIAKRVAAP